MNGGGGEVGRGKRKEVGMKNLSSPVDSCLLVGHEWRAANRKRICLKLTKKTFTHKIKMCCLSICPIYPKRSCDNVHV